MKNTILLALLIPFAASAGVYTCTDESGNTVFSQRPCGDDAERVEIQLNYEPDRSAPTTTSQPEEVSTTDSEDTAERHPKYGDFVEIRNTKLQIFNKGKELRGLQREMDEKLASLRAKKQRANNNLAGAIWEDSVSKEMTAVTNQYQSKIDAVQAEIDGLEAHLEEIGG